MNLFILFCLILILIALINPIGSTEKKKLQQKSFDEIFGEKWEEKEQKMQNEQKKREIIRKYYQIKEKIKEKGRKYPKKEWSKINTKIAKSLGINRNYIQKWIKEFGLQKNNSHKPKSDEQKFEIVQKFIEIKNEFKQKSKYSSKEWRQNYAEICKKIGVGYDTIRKWKKQFGIGSKRITVNEKMEKMKKYWQIKIENPKMSDQKIAEMINSSAQNICRWKAKFGEENFSILEGN